MRHPVFIVGMPRSGTSLLSAILNAHSQLAVSPETHYFTRCWDGPLQGSDHAEELLDCLFRQPGVGDMRLSDDEVASITSTVRECSAPDHRGILEALFDVYLAREEKPYWGEKTPDHWQHVPAIRETFPGAVFVSIVRDPRDVSLSLRKVPWNQRQTVIDHARQWNEYAQVSERYVGERDPSFKEIRYEDLLTNSEAVIREVLEFLDCAYEPQIAQFYRAGSQNVDTAREPWKQKTTRPIDPTNRDNWKDQMPAAERKIVEQICGSMMVVKGYRTEQLRWTPARAGQLARVLWKTLSGRIYRLRAEPWYLRPEATER